MSSFGPTTVLLTGATGFVGSRLARLLCAQGIEVHALARERSDRAALAGLPLCWHAGELEDAHSLEVTLEATLRAAGAPARCAVLHGAALISYRTRDAARAWRVNVEGTRALLDHARRTRVGRFVYVSSVVAVGHAPDASSSLDEEAAFNGADLGCHYVDTKRAAERLCLERAGELDVVVVNPGAIFGPAPKASNTTQFLLRIARGELPSLAPPGSLAAVGVEDVAQGILLALRRGQRGRRYLLTESNLRMSELYVLAGSRLGVVVPRRIAPQPVWCALVAGARLLDRLRALELATPQALRLLALHYRFDSARARRELGWRPRPFVHVLGETVSWMQGCGLLEGKTCV